VGFPAIIRDIYEYTEVEWSKKTEYRRNMDYLFERMDKSICSSAYCEADVYVPVNDAPVTVSGKY
jgi:hypothetical protein